MFEKITGHIHIRQYRHNTDCPNIGYILGANRALLFDAGNSGANVELLKRELTEAAPRPGRMKPLCVWKSDKVRLLALAIDPPLTS